MANIHVPPPWNGMSPKDFAEKYAGHIAHASIGGRRLVGRVVAYSTTRVIIEDPLSTIKRDPAVYIGIPVVSDGYCGTGAQVAEITMVKHTRLNHDGSLYSPGDALLDVYRQPARVQTENRYPKKCPKCSGPAYIGFLTVDCSRGCK